VVVHFARRVYLLAGVVGLLFVSPMYFLEARIAILEKVSYGLAAPTLFAAGRVSLTIFGAGLIDLGFAVLFAVAYGNTPSRSQLAGAQPMA